MSDAYAIVDILGNRAQQGCAAEWLVIHDFDPHPPDHGWKTSMLGIRVFWRDF